MKINTIQPKMMIVSSKLPGADFVINQYSGCSYGCVYCYAEFTRKFTSHLKDEWGSYVDVKTEFEHILRKEIKTLNKKIGNKVIWKNNSILPDILMSSVSDPYQGIEAKYKVTRRILEIFIDENYLGKLSILTKGTLVTRDIDLFEKLNIQVGMTITSLDDEISRIFETNAPLSTDRLNALKKLNKADISAYVCISPLFPHFADDTDSLDKLFNEIKEARTDYLFIEHINLPPKRMSLLIKKLTNRVDEKMIDKFQNSQTIDHKARLVQTVDKLIKKYNFRVFGGGVLDHENTIDGTNFFVK